MRDCLHSSLNHSRLTLKLLLLLLLLLLLTCAGQFHFRLRKEDLALDCHMLLIVSTMLLTSKLLFSIP